jgi:hypothetical protein
VLFRSRADQPRNPSDDEEPVPRPRRPHGQMVGADGERLGTGQDAQAEQPRLKRIAVEGDQDVAAAYHHRRLALLEFEVGDHRHLLMGWP